MSHFKEYDFKAEIWNRHRGQLKGKLGHTERRVYSFSSSSHSIHCLSEIHAKVTIFRVGSRARTFCMFYSVFHHITHKSLPPITSRGTDRICFQEILQTYQFKLGSREILIWLSWSLLLTHFKSHLNLNYWFGQFSGVVACYPFCILKGSFSLATFQTFSNQTKFQGSFLDILRLLIWGYPGARGGQSAVWLLTTSTLQLTDIAELTINSALCSHQ